MRLALGSWLICLAGFGCAQENYQRLHEYQQDGVRLYEKGSYEHARETFAAALALRPSDPNLLYNLACCHDKLKQPEQAEARFRQCLQIAPDHVECRHAYAEFLLTHERRDEAVAMTERWLRANPNLSAPYADDGWLWHLYGDLPRAQGRLQQALERDPRNIRALQELALVYEEMHRQDRAAALYERSLLYQPNQPEIQARLASLRKEGVGPPRPD